ncbi:hypothetical protein Agub_g10701 [Astrephomene gubernaculifera]|uniref:Uncharacterized protein n=1 Tax=Astrephomene gubernaculifera TaxID=47775 RepID=A0AAD3DY44_9CHLO|nr:hypothetical protein Agub_g10701 [Astrephomene gubernaculifera]
MSSPRGRGRGGRSLWPWPLRIHSVRKLLLLLSAVIFLAVQVHFYNHTTRRFKDCSVPWVTEETAVAAAAAADGVSSSSSNLRGLRGDAGGSSGGHHAIKAARVSKEGAASSSSPGGGRRSRIKPLRIALVSMSTGRAHDAAAVRQQAAVNARSAEFSGLLDVTGPNKAEYALRHGYTYVDASELLDASRPASWSKIPAVLSVLDSYDWVFWLDADTLITNMSLPLETLLPAVGRGRRDRGGSGGSSSSLGRRERQDDSSDGGGGSNGRGGGGGGDVDVSHVAEGGAEAAAGGDEGHHGLVGPRASPDLILTMDSTGVNAGVWIMRGSGCGWCRTFLQHWWSLDSFVRHGPHDTKSGDNDALKHLIATMERSERAMHVGLAPQCSFNSYLWRPSLRNWLRYLANPRHILTGLWQPGDFVLHPAGVQNKMAVLQRFLRQHAGRAGGGGGGAGAGGGGAATVDGAKGTSWQSSSSTATAAATTPSVGSSEGEGLQGEGTQGEGTQEEGGGEGLRGDGRELLRSLPLPPPLAAGASALPPSPPALPPPRASRHREGGSTAGGTAGQEVAAVLREVWGRRGGGGGSSRAGRGILESGGGGGGGEGEGEEER